MQVEDYFRVKRVTELALSPSGQWLVAMIKPQTSLVAGSDQQVLLYKLRGKPPVREMANLADGRQFSWIPGTSAIAFISDRAGIPQVFSQEIGTGEIEQRTRGNEPVVRFKFAPNGQALAYTTCPRQIAEDSMYNRFRDGNEGILINPDVTSVYDFVDPAQGAYSSKQAESHLWLIVGETSATSIALPGDVEAARFANFFWSSDSSAMSVTYVARNVPESIVRSSRSSVGIYSIPAASFQVIGDAHFNEVSKTQIAYLGGEWLPSESAVLLQRVVERDIWTSEFHPELAIVETKPFTQLAKARWQPIETYPPQAFMPLRRSRILTETTLRGTRSLYEIDPTGVKRSNLVSGIDGSSSLIQLSDHARVVAFVNQSLTRPPEIYTKAGSGRIRQVSALNPLLRTSLGYRSREVQWASKDGVTVSGWLLEPVSTAEKKPLPLVTYIHGGPTGVQADVFAQSFKLWPHPLEVMAAKGIAVLIPNYRGSLTFGRNFSAVTATDAEPIADIISGVNALITQGFADPSRLGISGHSHGAWLAPLVLARFPIFQVGSFAEGIASAVTAYELMPGSLNKYVHSDPANWGGSLFDVPKRYLELSPDLHFGRVNAAMLFEAGAQSAGIDMLGFPKAALHSGNAAEYFVYPRTAHNMTDPVMMRESAERNLDWFRFWLQGYEDAKANKVEQYARWRELRGIQAKNVNGERH